MLSTIQENIKLYFVFKVSTDDTERDLEYSRELLIVDDLEQLNLFTKGSELLALNNEPSCGHSSSLISNAIYLNSLLSLDIKTEMFRLIFDVKFLDSFN